MTPIPALVCALNEFRPAVVGSYPTALAVLAEEQAAGRLRIAPALLLSGAERLSPPLAERISESFRCPVRDTYAARNSWASPSTAGTDACMSTPIG
jgi:phenylacetate-coenzyme A ligase PaaK-like adenylate-forming protein